MRIYRPKARLLRDLIEELLDVCQVPRWPGRPEFPQVGPPTAIPSLA